VLGVVTAGTVARAALGDAPPGSTIGAELIALYTATARQPARTAWPAVGIAIAALLAPATWLDPTAGEVVGSVLFMAAATGLGAYVRSRRLDTAAELAQRDRRAGEVVAAERARIARELHDVVAHSVTVMSAQVGAARMVLNQHPERATEALSAAERAGRQAIAELRRMLGLLRPSEAAPARAAQPSLRQLPTLVEQFRDAGLEVRLRAEPPDDLPPGLDLGAYRIAQEALTTCSSTRRKRKASSSRCTGNPTASTSSSRTSAATSHPPRTADTGSSECVSGPRCYGGSVEAGPRPGGGWKVHAVLPAARGYEPRR
jgi:signal transduction histidine kinase